MEKEIMIRGKKITYFEEGEGPPILIIHGWSPKAIVEFSKLQLLLTKQGYRVILLNLPGFGGSWLPLHKWDISEYIQCIVDFINLLELKKIILLGHSLGGTIAIRLAATHPQRIKALILLSPGVIPALEFNVWGWRAFSFIIYGWLAIIKVVEFFLYLFFIILKKLILFIARLVRLKRVLERIGSSLKLLKTRYGLVKILKRIVRGADTLSYLPEINCSVLTVWGEKDFNFDLAARFMGRIPDYTLKIIPGAGHNFQRDEPEKTVEITLKFIKKVALERLFV